MASFTVTVDAINLASIKDKGTTDTYPEVDFLLSKSPIKSESTNTTTSFVSHLVLSYSKPQVEEPLRYLIIHSTAL